MLSLGWVELNDRHFIKELTIVCDIFRGFSVLDGVFTVSGLFLTFLRLDAVLFQEIFVDFCTALRTLLCSCLTRLVYRNTIGN